MTGRRKILIAGAILVALAAANIWIRRPAVPQNAFGPPVPREFDAGIRARMDEAIAALPQERQSEARQKVDETAAFLASVKDLPEETRAQKVRDHLRENPLPFLRPPGPPPDQARGGSGAAGGGGAGGSAPRGGPGGGGPGAGHIPPPEERYSMDQNIATEQEKAKTP